jgi:ankyrin repeat protein
MRRAACVALVVAVSTSISISCKRSPKDAREELAKLGVPFTSEEFIARCGVGPTTLIETFLVAGADPNVVYTSQHSYTPLISAASAGRIDIAKQLLKAGARVDLVAEDGRTAVDAASENCKKPDMVKFLIDQGGRAGENSLLTALWKVEAHPLDCSHATIGYLLQAGADPNQRDTKGMTALMVAADRVDAESVRLLLQYKADVNVQAGPYRSTALHAACRRSVADRQPSTLAILKDLLRAGADPNLRDALGQTALDSLGPPSVTPYLNPLREAITRPR